MKVAVLSSTRADFGIYYPLLRALNSDSFFKTEIIAFGTHLSDKFGYTLNEIINSGFEVPHRIESLPKNDSPLEISKAVGSTINKFADFWANTDFDLVFCLGDRYEMFAAVTAGLPFNIKFAHIHAGETTLGAIDNAYRHSISLMSEYLFVTTEEYKKRGEEILGNYENVFNVGALSIDNLNDMQLFSNDEFYNRFQINIDKPYILSTFHPETVSFDKNEEYIDELLKAFEELNKRYKIIITMPNADTMGLLIRSKLEVFTKNRQNVHLVESFGSKGYLTCMKNCSFLLGNSSSGFVEAAYFPKWVINIGNRQKGRIRTPNILDCLPNRNAIIQKAAQLETSQITQDCNIYGDGNTAKRIIKILKQL